MTSTFDQVIRAALRSVTPRAGFEAELLGLLGRDMPYLQPVANSVPPSRHRWLVVGAVAGVASAATGAAYWGIRRHRHKGVA